MKKMTMRLVLCFSATLTVANAACLGQQAIDPLTIRTTDAADETGNIIIHTHGEPSEPPVFFTARADANAQVDIDRIEQIIRLSVEVIQGKAETLSFGFNGRGDITEVQGDAVRAWSVRREGTMRFLDLHVDEGTEQVEAVIITRSDELTLPATVDVQHLTPGEAVGFSSTLTINYAREVDGNVVSVSGFVPLEVSEPGDRFQTTTGGGIQLSLSREGTAPAPIEFVDVELSGQVDADGRSISTRLRGVAKVSEPGAEITILSGHAAVSRLPDETAYRLRLSNDHGLPVYRLVFSEVGEIPLNLEFVASIATSDQNWSGVDFTIGASAVVPLTLTGLESDLEFQRDRESVVPLRDNDSWVGFLPATGRAKLRWKASRKAGDGKLFFATTGRVETSVGAGLMRQAHAIDYQILQGELKSLGLLLQGPGEILDAQGDNVVGWQVRETADGRRLDVTLSQSITDNLQLLVRSRTTLGAFPTRVEGLRLTPVDAIRHSGYLRLTNVGSVRLEPTGLSGLTQLAPDQYPGDPTEARQTFVYRFPSASHAFTVAVDRIQPEVNVSQLVVYEMTETDRVIRADIELDIRQAPIREWEFSIPSDYSVVTVVGASVADYVVASEVTDGRRGLNVIFGQDVSGRQLVTLNLEKSEAPNDQWNLPRIDFPGAKSVRGDVGVMGAPGFRLSVDEISLLVEKPLSYFSKPSAQLQQAFRLREPLWSANLLIERLDRSVQSDVFHLYSLSKEKVYGSALINYFVTGAPVSELRVSAPAALGNVAIDGQDIRTWRREDDTLIVSLHQPVMGAYTLLVSFEEKPDERDGSFTAGVIEPLEVQGERGYVQVVSPIQVEFETVSISDDMLQLDPLELPAELRLLSTAPPLGTWQYTERPFELALRVSWFQPGTMVSQVVEFSEANSRVSQDGESVTDVVYYVKSRGQRTLRVRLPDAPLRLWEVSVDGQPVTARQADDATLIPLPGGTDPNVPVEVRLRLGKPTVDASNPQLALPTVLAPILKTQWSVVGDEKRVLIPNGGTVTPPEPVLRPSGFSWVAKRGIAALLLIGLFTVIGAWSCRQSGWMQVVGLLSLAIAIGVSVYSASTALSESGSPRPLEVNLPVFSAGESIELQVRNTPTWRVNLSWLGLTALIGGIASVAWSLTRAMTGRIPLRIAGVLLVALGLLLQRDGAPWFFALVALAIFVVLFVPPAFALARGSVSWMRKLLAQRKARKAAAKATTGDELGPATTAIILFALMLPAGRVSWAEVPQSFKPADSVQQQWMITERDARLTARGSIKLSGRPGDRFVLLRAPAVLTRFEGEGLRLSKKQIRDEGLAYVVSIDTVDDSTDEGEVVDREATFDFQLEAVAPTEGVPVLTGSAAVQEINLDFDATGWDVVSPTAVRVESIEAPEATRAKVLLGPGSGTLILKPKARDVTTEQTQFFVEASNLYLAGPGVVDGRHRLNVRPAQGQVRELSVLVPSGLTVSTVSGPVGSWQFDAENGFLKMEIEPAQAHAFDVLIETQRGLDPLPADVTLAPLQVEDTSGEVGLIAVAFGSEAQPERLESADMSAVNLGDFDASLLQNQQAVLHRVYRYDTGGELTVRVAPVDPEIRVVSQQVLSLGDERVVLGVNFVAEISRAGLFQLSFPLPDGLEVESLTGAALNHWTELTETDGRQIILHLNGRTIGTQSFALALSGPSAADVDQWAIPRFELNEATRQTGELVVRPTTGIRLRTITRQNVSETDPRTMGGESRGSLAFRLLQRDWNLVLGVEKLDPWVTAQVLHDVTLREGQTRSTLIGRFNVQNAAIRTLQVELPLEDEDEIKTVRASGGNVSDFIRTAPDSDIWEVQFKRRVVGNVDFRIEYERRGDRENDTESIRPARFPQAGQLSYFFAIRAGGRLELEQDPLPTGWEAADWSTVPSSLRESENRSAPVFTLRTVADAADLTIRARRHSLADALRLRVAKGTLTTVLSPTGNQLTSVDMTVEVIQRSSLNVGLPQGSELINIFVNGESVNTIRRSGGLDSWQFYILPGIDERTAEVRFVYSVSGDRLRQLKVVSPELNVPLENVQWNVIAPKGFELTDSDGNLELIGESLTGPYDRKSYLSRVSGTRQVQAQQAAQLLEQANRLLQVGEQTKARWAFNSVANQYALDAASNEDARVQLENLQTQQAVVGLNTRRQRLYLDNRDEVAAEDPQLRQAAADNPILQQNQLNFRPQQLTQLLQGNSAEDNAVLQRIAGRLVQHQHAAETAPQAIIISLPEEGSVYTFGRTVQVAENAPLELDLDFDRQLRVRLWQTALVFLLLGLLAVTFVYATTHRQAAT